MEMSLQMQPGNQARPRCEVRVVLIQAGKVLFVSLPPPNLIPRSCPGSLQTELPASYRASAPAGVRVGLLVQPLRSRALGHNRGVGTARAGDGGPLRGSSALSASAAAGTPGAERSGTKGAT